jgi:hypothetical protein
MSQFRSIPSLILSLGALISAVFLVPAIALAQEVDPNTQEALRSAVLEYDQLEVRAVASMDPSVLAPRAADPWLSRRTEEIENLKSSGYKQDQRLIDAQILSFSPTEDGNAVAVNTLQTWNIRVTVAANGLPILQTGDVQVPQTLMMAQDAGGSWKVVDVFQTGLTSVDAS